MPDNPKEETQIFIEYPEVHSYQFDKKANDIYITFYDDIMTQDPLIRTSAIPPRRPSSFVARRGDE